MAEDEKVKKWLEEQEKIKSELTILAGSLKGTRNTGKDTQSQKVEEPSLNDAAMEEDTSTGIPPKAPEEVYIAEEFKFPEKSLEAGSAPTAHSEPQSGPLPAKPAIVPKKVIPPGTAPPDNVISPASPPSAKPIPNAQPTDPNSEFSEIINYIEEKISRTPDYIDFTRARELLDTAISLLNEQNSDEALKYAKYSQKEVKKTRLRYLRVKKLMKQVKREMIDLRKRGINIKVQKDIYSQAQIALKNNNFQRAIELVNTCKDENAKNI
jgi:hypothetical protein